MAHEGGGDLQFFKYLLIHSNKLTAANLQLMTVLAEGNSSSKSHEQGYLDF